MKKRVGSYPRVRIEGGDRAVVTQAGGVLLVETVVIAQPGPGTTGTRSRPRTASEDSLPGMGMVAVPLVLVTLLWALYFASSTPNQGLGWALVGIAGSLLLLPIAFGSLGAIGGDDPYLEYYGVDQGTRPGPIFAVIGVLLVFTGNFTAIAQNASRTGR